MQNKINLISISGRIGSGKDTLANMIQYITSDKEHKFEFWNEKSVQNLASINSGWEIRKFAGKLKEVASLLTGIETWRFESKEFKKSQLKKEWGYMTIREFLQKLGTEGLRGGLHKDVWVNALFADYNESTQWIITDCRFANEYVAVKKREGVTIRLTRNMDIKASHLSETALDTHDFDYIIDNRNLSIEQTFEEVKKICYELKIASPK